MGLCMLGFIGKGHKLPPLKNFPLQHYVHHFFLDHLVLGVDNIRHDVYLSPTFISATRKTVTRLITRHAGVEKTEEGTGQLNWAKEVESYKKLYREIR
jgi:hypothetical protein